VKTDYRTPIAHLQVPGSSPRLDGSLLPWDWEAERQSGRGDRRFQIVFLVALNGPDSKAPGGGFRSPGLSGMRNDGSPLGAGCGESIYE
jgi:hypothetical protein